MGVEVRPLGVHCNIRCHYCYQNPERDAGAAGHRYDLEKIKAAVTRAGGPFTLFGGEPLLLRLADLEDLLRWGHERYGSCGIQTNGSLITDEHIGLFKACNVRVGISIDGPDALNDVRSAGSSARTRAMTARTQAAIARLCREGLAPSLIVTLHRGNASGEHLPRLYAWVRELAAIGVRSMRLHLLEVEDEDVRRRYALSTAENIRALAGFAALERELPTLRFDLFEDLRRMLMGRDRSTTCVWNACDPYTTRAVQGIEGNGQRSNCGRTNKDGIEFIKAEQPGYERYLALYHTPQAHGGCRGCRFFLMCKGQCPGTAIDGDWRNRSEHCDVWKTLLAGIEASLVRAGRQPLSLHPIRRAVEATCLAAWARRENPTVAQILARLQRRRA